MWPQGVVFPFQQVKRARRWRAGLSITNGHNTRWVSDAETAHPPAARYSAQAARDTVTATGRMTSTNAAVVSRSIMLRDTESVTTLTHKSRGGLRQHSASAGAA